jgi:hypothetical protein
LFDRHDSRASSLISSYITALHLHLRIALGSKHSTCDPSRHWDKKYDMQWGGTSERSSPNSTPCSVGISDGLLSHWVTPKSPIYHPSIPVIHVIGIASFTVP